MAHHPKRRLSEGVAMSEAASADTDVREHGLRRTGSWLLGRWPSLLGILVAALAVYGAHGTDLAPLVLLLGINYLVAEISRKRWMAWVGTLAIFVLYPVSQRLDPELLQVLVVVAAIAGVLVGLLVARVRSGGEITIQTGAMLAFGAVAAVALFINPTVGAYLVAAGLIGHGIWDAVHYRRNVVVARSFAEFCAVLDIIAGAAVIWVTLATPPG